MRDTRVSLSVTTHEPEVLTRAIESMGRCAAGLALEEVQTVLFCDVYEDDPEEETE